MARRNPKVTVKSLESDVTADPRNANKGTARGRKMIGESINRNGAGRSLLLDKNGAAIAGNKSREQMIAQGITEVIVVETDGTQAVAVQRVDLELDGEDGRAREIAYYDNRTSEIDLNWAVPTLGEDIAGGFDASLLWDDEELKKLLATTIPDSTPQSDPATESECLIQIRCTHADLSEIQTTLEQWDERETITVDVSG